MRQNGIHARVCRFFALAVACIPLTASADEWFTPPRGWAAVSHPAALLGAWVHPGDVSFRQNIVAGASRTTYSATQWDEANLPKLRAALPNFVLGADADTTSCGRPAHYMSYASFDAGGRKIIYEHMTTVVSGVAFFVIYSRLATQPSLPEARGSLTTLCGAVLNVHPAPPVAQPAAQPAPATPPPPQDNATPVPQPAASQGTY